MAFRPLTWLASFPKSGSTWARMLLTAYHNNGLYLDINSTLGESDVSAISYQAATSVPLGLLTDQEHAWIRQAALVNVSYRSLHPVVLVKTHAANAEFFGVRLIPPALTHKAIYIARDPRAIVPSLARHLGDDYERAIEHLEDDAFCLDGPVKTLISSWTTHVRSWQSQEIETVLVRYEDMLADPADALERMLLVCNIRPDAERIARSVELCAITKLQEQERELGFRERSHKTDCFFGGSPKWETELTSAQVLRIEQSCAEQMAVLGYKRVT